MIDVQDRSLGLVNKLKRWGQNNMKIPTPTATREELLALHGNKEEEETKKTEDPRRSRILLLGKITEDG